MTQLFNIIAKLLAIIAGHQLVIEKQRDWGIKEVYHVNNEELLLLIKAGAEIITLNEASGDDTYLHKVKFQNAIFMQSTTHVIEV